ncbi:MAG: type II secretion system protein M [Bdellovibrionales bacterium]|nr:type II secretion system protein M [Bdellovibrionales bacterium]
MDAGTFLEKIKEQEFYQQLQSAYQQLSSEQQGYVKWGAAGAGFLVLFFLIFSMIQAANGTKNEYYEHQELARIVTDASDELRRLKGQSSGMAPAGEQNWKSILMARVTSQGIPAESLEILKESAGATQSVLQESVLEIKLKNVPLRPLVQILTQMEQGSPPMKLKGLLIETASEDGKLTAKISVSGYLAKQEKDGSRR